jgi:hypothetical protein
VALLTVTLLMLSSGAGAGITGKINNIC